MTFLTSSAASTTGTQARQSALSRARRTESTRHPHVTIRPPLNKVGEAQPKGVGVMLGSEIVEFLKLGHNVIGGHRPVSKEPVVELDTSIPPKDLLSAIASVQVNSTFSVRNPSLAERFFSDILCL